jgi:hypothetical protein
VTDEQTEVYFDFASKISFFEFIQDEFRASDLNLLMLKEEIAELESHKIWNISDLSDYITKYPKSFFIFQEMFQLIRFTNAQLIHFIFDIARLNSLNMESIFQYLIYNLKHDEEFRKLYLKLPAINSTYEEFMSQLSSFEKEYLIALFKFAISKYVDRVSKKLPVLEKRIKRPEFSDFSIRFSSYLIENLKLNEFIEAVNIEKFLKNKRIPIDTKNIHGNFPKMKIKESLLNNGFVCIDDPLKTAGVSELPLDGIGGLRGIQELKDDNLFCTEKYVEGVVRNNGRPKKLDLVILRQSKPKYLFEINFYSTAGTKIGINESEYISLFDHIKGNFPSLEFYWITDGNYWLTSSGRQRFLRLINHFGAVYNINLFIQSIDKFKHSNH